MARGKGNGNGNGYFKKLAKRALELTRKNPKALVKTRIDAAERTYCCKICDFPDLSEEEMIMHNKFLHIDDKEICDECLNTFHSDRALVTHKLKGHSIDVDMYDFNCVHCTPRAGFRTAAALKEHTNALHGCFIYLCKFCCNLFKFERDRDIHKSGLSHC